MTHPITASASTSSYLDYLPTEVHEKISWHLDLKTYIEYSSLYLRDHSHLQSLRGLVDKEYDSLPLRQKLNPMLRRILGLTSAPIDAKITPFLTQGAVGYELSVAEPLTLTKILALDHIITKEIRSQGQLVAIDHLIALTALGGRAVAELLSSLSFLERLSPQEKILTLSCCNKLSYRDSMNLLLRTNAYSFLNDVRTYGNAHIKDCVATFIAEIIFYSSANPESLQILLDIIPQGHLPSGAVLDEVFSEEQSTPSQALTLMLAHSADGVDAGHLRVLFLAHAEKKAARACQALANLPTLAAIAGAGKVVKELILIDAPSAIAVIGSPLFQQISVLDLFRVWKRAIAQEKDGTLSTALAEARTLSRLSRRCIAALLTHALEHRNFHAAAQLLYATQGQILPLEEIAVIALISRESGADFVEVAISWLREQEQRHDAP